jgi:hypothetical protein
MKAGEAMTKKRQANDRLDTEFLQMALDFRGLLLSEEAAEQDH